MGRDAWLPRDMTLARPISTVPAGSQVQAGQAGQAGLAGQAGKGVVGGGGQNYITSTSPICPSPLSAPLSIPPRAPRRRSVLANARPTPPTPPTPSEYAPTSPSPPLSRSHPLLGSYPLSLLHSRMSTAHTHSHPSGFSLHISARGRGKQCPPELRCPGPLVVPFQATYYDLEDGGRTTQSPWVGTADIEGWHYDTYSHHAPSYSPITPTPGAGPSGSSKMPAAPPVPPAYPGLRLAPVGQLQILVHTPQRPVKVFLVPYDLRQLLIGGRLLARERTYVRGHKGEKLRYSYQLQFHCRPRDPPVPARESSTTRRPRRSESGLMEGEKEYYLCRTVKVIFTSTPPESSEDLRTERADEVVLPSEDRGRVSAGASPLSVRRLSTGVGSVGSTREDWEVVRRKWIARKEMESSLAFDALELRELRAPSPSPPVSLLSSQVLVRPGPHAKSEEDGEHARTGSDGDAAEDRQGNGSDRSLSPVVVTASAKQKLAEKKKLGRKGGTLDERELSERLRMLEAREGGLVGSGAA